SVVFIKQDNAGDDKSALILQQDASMYALEIDVNAEVFGVYGHNDALGAGTVAWAFGDTDGSGGSNYFTRNLASGDTAGALLRLSNDNAGDDQEVLSITQVGTGPHIELGGAGTGGIDMGGFGFTNGGYSQLSRLNATSKITVRSSAPTFVLDESDQDNHTYFQQATNVFKIYTTNDAQSSFKQRFSINHGTGAVEVNEAFTAGTITSDGIIAGTTLNTGQGAYELFAMNQDVESTDAVTFVTVDTGQGANELYDMDQDVEKQDMVTFARITIDSNEDILANLISTDGTGELRLGDNVAYTKFQSIGNSLYIKPADGQLTAQFDGNTKKTLLHGPVQILGNVNVTDHNITEVDCIYFSS
ncbi:MAG: hypothetical protein ACTSPI_18135, partial [Candidatus Heimdallarchaeaceae archaeon]